MTSRCFTLHFPDDICGTSVEPFKNCFSHINNVCIVGSKFWCVCDFQDNLVLSYKDKNNRKELHFEGICFMLILSLSKISWSASHVTISHFLLKMNISIHAFFSYFNSLFQ